jgi:DNA repair protein RecN (Recombination protein N)
MREAAAVRHTIGAVLLEMRLSGLGVIREAVLGFGPGLTVVTGETGAGKTMVVTGLGLLLGGRSDAGAVRSGATSAVVEGRVQVDPAGPVAERAREAGAQLDDGDVLVVVRSVSAEGRSRAHLGGRGVPVGVLGELAGDLVAVHGQSDQIRLQSTARQRAALDRFAGERAAGPLADYRRGWRKLREVEATLADITARARERAQEAELLRLGLAEVERVAPQPGEDVELRAEAARLGHAEALHQAAAAAQRLLTGDPDDMTGGADIAGLLASLRRGLDAVLQHDGLLASLAERAGEISYLVDDLATDCASYAAGVESDPLRLAAVEERRAALAALTRGYGGDVEAVLAWAAASSERLRELDGDQDAVGELTGERQRVRARLGELAGQVSAARAAAAERLAEAVTAELQELSMGGASLVVRVTQRPDEAGLPVTSTSGTAQVLAAGPEGVDDVEILLCAHAGASPRPLGKGASGGELSRVMLGLEVVLGAADPVPTYVFDEVDAGVGGRAALGIGRRLALLARTSQVLVVTHLAQVAAFADHHLHVVKSSDDSVTESGVHALDRAGRVRELARMLGGVEDSGTAQAHAEELLAMAEGDRVNAAAAGRPSAAAGERADAAAGDRKDVRGGARTPSGRRRGTIGG